MRDYGGQVLYGTSPSLAKFRGPQLVHHGVSGLAVVLPTKRVTPRIAGRIRLLAAIYADRSSDSLAGTFSQIVHEIFPLLP
ncbi:hypothetical protein WJ17_27075 [Burkholderia vietnamiensis]|nr:hypothetical protein WJ17_27075 [Burkholderia vietnamiensis]